jgi:hypothetical protein
MSLTITVFNEFEEATQPNINIEEFEICGNNNPTSRPPISPGNDDRIGDPKACTHIGIDRNPGCKWYIKLENPGDYEFIINGETVITGIGYVNLPNEYPYLIIKFAPKEPSWILKIKNPGGYSAAQPSNVTIGEDKT